MIADALGRYTSFTQSLLALRKPVNTAIDYEVGSDRGRSRNTLVRRSLERGSEWMLFLDDDHDFPSDLLQTLLSREMPVVASLYLQRGAPFLPIAMAEHDEKGDWWPLDLTKCPGEGLVTIMGAGTGGMLIRSEVFRAIEPPWFRHTTEQSEDLFFCDLVNKAGIQIYLDLEARLGHTAPFAVYPDYLDGKWAAGVAIPGLKATFPIVMPDKPD